MSTCFWTDIVGGEQRCDGGPAPEPEPDGVSLVTLGGYGDVVHLEGVGWFETDYQYIGSEAFGGENINNTGLTTFTPAAGAGVAVFGASAGDGTMSLLTTTDGVNLTRYDGVAPRYVAYNASGSILYHAARDTFYWFLTADYSDPSYMFYVYEASPADIGSWSLVYSAPKITGVTLGGSHRDKGYIHATGELVVALDKSTGNDGQTYVCTLGPAGGFSVFPLDFGEAETPHEILYNSGIGYAAGSGRYLVTLDSWSGAPYGTYAASSLTGEFTLLTADELSGWFEVPGTPYACSLRSAPPCDWETSALAVFSEDGQTEAFALDKYQYPGDPWEEEMWGASLEPRLAVQIAPEVVRIYIRVDHPCG